ncbi:MAG: hypothetical protein EOM06_08130 [Sphingobacteriia bacterium]|nr:hypothetical protein [Sphingobacteriia bacterium]
MQNFNTLNDLILFACSESHLSDAEKFRKVSLESQKFSKEFQAIITVKNYLSSAQIGPSKTVLQNIMGFSRAFSVTKTRSSGSFSLLLN